MTARGDVSWLTDYERAKLEAKESHKLLLVDFTGSDWCGWCIRLRREVFSQPEFQEYAKKNLVLLEIDFPRAKEQSRDLRTQNQNLAMQYNIAGFPTIVVLNGEGKQVGVLGYMPGGASAFIAELEKLSPAFRWQVYFTKVGMPSIASLNVSVPAFIKTMNEAIEKESLPDWKTYLRWHLVHANAAHLSSAFLNENFAFYGKTLQGQEELKPRWKRCTEYVDDYLGEALGQAYVQKYFGPEAKQQALKIVKEIQVQMEQDINSLPWMSAATKQQALAKLHGMANKIGYPDKWRHYSKLEIIRGDEPGNVDRARKFEFDRQLAKIGKPVDHGEWGMTPPTVNAYYDPQMNDINFPAGCSLLHSTPSLTPLPTTATPAVQSVTNSLTASTMKAASSTRRAICATGGPRTTEKNS